MKKDFSWTLLKGGTGMSKKEYNDIIAMDLILYTKTGI